LRLGEVTGARHGSRFSTRGIGSYWIRDL